MGKEAPDAPEPIDPRVTIGAQTESNLATAREQQRMNMINTNGPQGAVRYEVDPSAPSGYRQVTDLSPGQQSIYDLGTAAQSGALDIAGKQLGRIDTALGRELTPPQLQESFNSGRPLTYNFNDGGPLQRSFDPGQAVQGSVGPSDFSAERDQVIDNEFGRARSRLDPMWDQQQEKDRVRRANQGLSENSSANITAEDNFGRAKNDAYSLALSDAVRAGGAEQDRLFNEKVAQGQFANQAAAQQFSQNAGQAGFENDATLSDFDRNMAQAGFNNTTSGQEYAQNQGAANFTNAGRQANFQNTAFSRSSPISDFAALLGTGQVMMPNSYQGPTTGVNGTDVMGAYGLYEQGRQSNYAQQAANVNSRNAAFGNLAGAVMMGPMAGMFKPAV